MKQEVRGGLVVVLSLLVVFCTWKLCVYLPEFPRVFLLDYTAPAAITATPTPEPSAQPQEVPRAVRSMEYAICRTIASGVSFSQRILDAYMPDMIRLKRSIKNV